MLFRSIIKKKILLPIVILLIALSAVTVCYAGDIPESLLNSDSAQIYFGEIIDIDGESITVVQRQNIKGEFSKDSVQTYEKYIAQSPTVGEIYLCGFLDEDNPLYIWQVSGLELNDLKIVDAAANSMAERMQSYINEGTFTEKELERQAKAEINNADETESIPIDTADVAAADNSAAEVSGCSGNILIFVLIVLVIIAATGFFVFRKRKGH